MTAVALPSPRSAHQPGWAYGGVIIGGVVSVLANVAHSYVRPDGAPDGWSPQGGAVASSIFWPVALFVALEVLVRTDWPQQWLWVVVKVCGLLPIAAVAAVVSYQHLSGLLTSYGESSFAATFGPVAVDGLMVISSAALLAGSIAASRPVAVPVASQVSDRATEPEPQPEPQAEPVEVSRPRAVAAVAPRRPQVSAPAGRKVRPSREKKPCVDGCDRHDGPVSYDTRQRCADRLGATA